MSITSKTSIELTPPINTNKQTTDETNAADNAGNADNDSISEDDNESTEEIAESIRGKEHFQISSERYLWSSFLVLVSWFSILSVPLPIILLNYNLYNTHHVWFTILCYSADVIFLFDICLRFVYPTLRLDNDKVWTTVDKRSGTKGRMQYLCSPSAFAVDIVSMFPFELIGLALSGQHVWLLRSNRLFRLLRLSHLWSVVSKYEWEHHYYGSVHQRRMWALFFTMAVSAHFAGLIFYLIALETARDTHGGGTKELVPALGITTWPERDGLWTIAQTCDTAHGFFTRSNLHSHFDNSTLVVCLQEPSFTRYCRSLYWAVITMVTIGFGDIVPATRSGTLFCTIVLYVGVTITACAVANLTRMAAASDSEATEQQNYVDQVERYLEFRHVAERTKNHVRHYFKYGRSNDSGRKEIDKVFQGFPLGTSMAAIEDAPFRVLHACPAFSSLPDSLVHALAGRLKLRVFVPDQNVTVRGSRCKMTMFLRRGQAAVVDDIESVGKEGDGTSSSLRGQLKRRGSFASVDGDDVEEARTMGGRQRTYLRLLDEGSCLGLQALVHPNTWHQGCHGDMMIDRAPSFQQSDLMHTTKENEKDEEDEEDEEVEQETKEEKKEQQQVKKDGNGERATVESEGGKAEKLENSENSETEDVYNVYIKAMSGLYPEWNVSIVSRTYCECWTLQSTTFVTTVRLAAQPEHHHHSHHHIHHDPDHPHHPANFVETIRRAVWDAYHDETSTHYHNQKLSMRALTTHRRWSRSQRTFCCCTSCQCCESKMGITKSWSHHMHPQSKFRRVWSILCFLGITFNTFSVPGAVAFLFSGTYHILIPAILVDIFFLVDIILNMYGFSFYDDEDGRLIRASSRIRSRYFASNSFKIDIIAAVPLDFFAILEPVGYRYLPLLRLVKVVRISHLYKYFENMENLALESGVKGCTTALRRLIRLYFLLVVVLHWVACGWYLLGQCSPLFSFGVGWLKVDQDNPNRNIETMSGLNGFVGYFRALYFVLVGASTVGYGDIVPSNILETVYAIIAMLFGGLLKPAVVGGIASLIFTALSKELPVYQYNRRLKAFTKREKHNLTRQFHEQTSRYVAYLHDRPSLFVESMVLRDLPRALRSEVLDFIVGSTVRGLPFWKSITPDREFFDDIVAALAPRHYLPSDYIVYEGEFGRSMFFLCSGKAQVTVATISFPVANLVAGQYFGETALLSSRAIRTANVVSTSYCDCFVLDRDDFRSIVALHNINRYQLEDAILETLSRKKKSNEKKFSSMKMLKNNNTELNEENKDTIDGPNDGHKPENAKINNLDKEDEGGEGVASEESKEDNDVHNNSGHIIMRKNSYTITDDDFYSLHPDSSCRSSWNFILMVGVLYYLIITPLRLAFVEGIPISMYAIDGILDFLYVADAFLRAQYFAFFSKGKLIKRRADLWSTYKNESLLVDLFTCIPFGLFSLLQTTQPTNAVHLTLWTLALLRMNKLIHVRRLFSLGAHIKSLLGLFTLVVVIANFAASLFYMFARLESNHPGEIQYDACMAKTLNVSNDLNITESNAIGLCTWEGTWIALQFTDNLLPLDGGSQIERYLRSFNWAMPTLLVVVIGDATPVNFVETLYVIAIILFGLIVNAMVLGVMADRLTDTASERSVHRSNMDMVERWLILSNIGDHVLLCDRIRDHMRTSFHLTLGVNEDKVVTEMPRQLRHDYAMQSRVPQLKKCYVFEHASSEFLQALAERMISRHYSGGDVICVRGEYLSEMFVIKIGTVELCTEQLELWEESTMVDLDETKSQNDNENEEELPQMHQTKMTIKLLEVNDAFGGSSMVGHHPTILSAEALEHVVVYVLQRSIFLNILKQFPEETTNIPDLDVLILRRDSKILNSKVDKTVDEDEKEMETETEPEKQGTAEEVEVKVEVEFEVQDDNNNTEVGVKVDGNKIQTKQHASLHSTADYRFHWQTWAARWQIHSLFRDIWACISLINLLYYLVLVPLRISVLIEDRVSTEELVGWYVYGYLVDVFFLVDMFLRARRFHVSVDDIVIATPKDIFARYCRADTNTGTLNTDHQNIEDVPWWYPSEFVIDCVASFPFDFIALGLGLPSLKFLRLNRLLRSIWRMDELCDAVDRFVHQRFHLWSGFYSLMLKVWVTFWLVNHLSACFWLFIHRYLERNVEVTWATVDGVSTWDPLIGEHDIFHDRTLAYSRAFYFVIVVISTCGYGDIRPYTNLEYVFAQLVTLCGALGLASMVGTFLFYFQYIDLSGTTSVRQRFRQVMEYGDKNDWTYKRIGQLKRQCAYIWDETRFVSERAVLDLLSIPLQMDVVAITRGNIVKRARLMRNISSMQRCSLYFATRLRQEIFVQGQQIYHFGEPTVGFFIVAEGAVDIAVKDGDDANNNDAFNQDDNGQSSVSSTSSTTCKDRIVKPVEHFGAWSIKHKCRVDSAVALEDSHLYRCSVEDMYEVIERMSDEDAKVFVVGILV